MHSNKRDPLLGNWNILSIENWGNTGNREVNKIIQQFPQAGPLISVQPPKSKF